MPRRSPSKPRGTLQRAAVQADVGRIIEAYRHVGRDEVSVVPQIIDRGNDRVDLVYAITEGAKTTVRQINFVGNHAFGKRQLGAVIKTSATNILSFLTGGDVYDPDRIEQDRELLRLYYRSKGYADASVTSAKAEYDPGAKGFTLTFTIDEGPRYRFGDIGVICNVPRTRCRETPPLLLVTRRRRVRRQRAGQEQPRHSPIEMSKLGYPFAQATPHHSGSPSRRIDVAFVIDQGPRTYVERIEIHGNTRTRDYVIRREFDIAEGDRLQQDPDRSGRAAAEEPELFKTVKISNEPGSAPDRVVLDVEVVDQSTGDFNISGGYSTDRWLLAEVKVGDRNFYGTGKTVEAAVTYGQYARGINLSASEPYFLGTRVAAGIELFGRQNDARQLPVLWQQPMARRCSSGRRSPNSSACNGAIRSITRTSRWCRTAHGLHAVAADPAGRG